MSVPLTESSDATHEYFRTENRKLTFRECWWLARGWRVIFLWVPKVLGIPMELGAGLPRPRPFAERWVDPAQMPREVREKLEARSHELMKLGFDLAHYHVLVGNLMTSEAGGCYLLHASGETVVTTLYARSFAGPGDFHESDVTAFLTPLANGKMLVTTDQEQKLESAPGDDIVRLPHTRPTDLYLAHEARLGAARAAGELARDRITDTAQLAQVVDAHEQRSFDFHVKRGVWVPMQAPQVEAMRRRKAEFDARRAAAREDTAPGADIDFDAALAPAGAGTERALAEEAMQTLLEREQPARGFWGNRMGLLLISLAAFAAVAFYQEWRWQTVLIIIVVLFFHEAGHFLAMRWFGYRNVRMFFIPGLGAAVSGHTQFMPGYKRVIVALMGPVPGIVAGGLCWFIGERSGAAGWTLAAAVLVLLNGFNLAPILPFDGGRVVDDTIFCRDPWLRASFGVIAGVVLILLSFWDGTFLFRLLGIVVLISVPRAFRHDFLARKLKRDGFQPDAKVPIRVEGMETIVREIASSRTKPMDPRALKAEVLAVFDRWNVEPPSFGASMSLLSIYALSILAAMAVLYLTMFVRPPGAPPFFEKPPVQPAEQGKLT